MKVYDIKYSNLFYEGIWYQVFQSIFMKLYDIKYSNLFFMKVYDIKYSNLFFMKVYDIKYSNLFLWGYMIVKRYPLSSTTLTQSSNHVFLFAGRWSTSGSRG